MIVCRNPNHTLADGSVHLHEIGPSCMAETWDEMRERKLYALTESHKRQQEALAALGAMPEGYCFCYGQVRDPNKENHTGECRDAREALKLSLDIQP